MIVLDVETTGVNPEKNSIVSIGAVDFFNPQNQFYQACRIWDGAEINKDALKVNGFTEEQCRRLNPFSLAQTIHSFRQWVEKIDNQTFAGQNPSFDQMFLVSAIKKSNMAWSIRKRSVDMHSLAYAHMLQNGIKIPLWNKKTDLNTSKIFQYVGLLEQAHVHNALTDSKMTAEAISRIIFGKNLLVEYQEFSIPELFTST